MIRASDWMTRPVATIEETASVFDAARLMADKKIGALIILEKDAPKAIVTERDFLTKVLARGLDYKGIQVKEVMTDNLVCVEWDTPLLEIGRKMSKNRFRHVVVLKSARIMGIITATDMVHMVAS